MNADECRYSLSLAQGWSETLNRLQSAPIETSWQTAKRSEQEAFSHVPIVVCTYNGDSSLYVLSPLLSTWYVLCCNASIATKYTVHRTPLHYSTVTHTYSHTNIRQGRQG